MLIDVIFAKIKKEPYNIEPYEDCFSEIRYGEKAKFKKAHELSLKLRKQIAAALRKAPKNINIEPFFNLYKRTLLFDAPYSFDAYMLYLEINRKPEQRFYQPRRKVLKPAVEMIQKLVDNELDESFLSMPPRTGKTTLIMFLLTWIIGRNPERSNLYCAFSDTITEAMYNGVLEVIEDPETYTWKEVFPDCQVKQTNAQLKTININRRKRYASLTCRSLYGTLNGACDCDGFCVSDDLIGGIEEALNKDRLISAWSKVDNNLLPRAKEQAKIMWFGTRWSLADPIGIRTELLTNEKAFEQRRYKIINMPALNENDESNFNYAYGVGFTTEHFKQRRASFERNNDMASWNAQFMQQPIEREGALFTPDEFRYYSGELPDGTADRIFTAVDPAFGGGDFVAAPICFQYGEDIFIHDVVFSKLDKSVTQPMVAKKIMQYSVQASRFETTKSTESYREGVEDILKKNGYRHNMTSKPAPPNTSKVTRIMDKAPDIKTNMIFRATGHRSKEYEQFMQNVFSFKIIGKNKNDDAPDSLAMAADMAIAPKVTYSVFKRFI